MLRGRHLLPVALAAGIALTQLGGALAAYPGTNGVIGYTCGANVCRINADGTGGATLVTGATGVSWAQNGTRIAYKPAGTEIVVATYSNGTISNPQPAGGTASATDFALSPNGAQLAYVLSNQLVVSNSDGSGATVKNTNGALVSDPTWSPDGFDIAYASGPITSSQICIFDFDFGVSCAQAPPAGTTDRHPNWSPDNSKLVFDSTRGPVVTPALWTVGTTNLGTFTGSPAQLGTTAVSGSDPAYSPDGTKIAYVDTTRIATVAANGTSAADITGSSAGTAGPDWQPIPASGGGGNATGPPKNTSYPTIILPFGRTQPLVGDFLFATIGSWNPSGSTYTYQWKRCDPPRNFGQCIDIKNATFSSYTVSTADFGKFLRVQVTATNSLGTASQNSEATDSVTEVAPFLRVTPPITGDNVEGQTLFVEQGVWDGTALTFTYEWRRCDPFGNSCVPIAGATSSSYIQTADDIGHALRAYVTATNLVGSAVAITNHTFPTIAKPHFAPSVSSGPQLSGTASIGTALAATAGSWDGDTPITYAYQWQRCDAIGKACRNIVGATKLKYTVQASDVGWTLRVVVTATNAYGKATGMSDPSDPIPALPPHRRGRHIVGTAGNDYIVGTSGDDVIYGLAGNDTIFGGGGYDTIYGGPGNDIIHVGSTGRSRIYGGPGSDTIYAANGQKDFIDCGPGNDRAIVDAFDVVKNCEVVVIAGSTPAPAPPVVPPGP